MQLVNDFPREGPTMWDFALISLLRQQSSGELGYLLVPKVLRKVNESALHETRTEKKRRKMGKWGRGESSAL